MGFLRPIFPRAASFLLILAIVRLVSIALYSLVVRDGQFRASTRSTLCRAALCAPVAPVLARLVEITLNVLGYVPANGLVDSYRYELLALLAAGVTDVLFGRKFGSIQISDADVCVYVICALFAGTVIHFVGELVFVLAVIVIVVVVGACLGCAIAVDEDQKRRLDLAEAQQKCSKLNADLKQLRRQLSRCQNDLRFGNDERDKLSAKCDELRSQLSTKIAQVSSLEEQLKRERAIPWLAEARHERSTLRVLVIFSELARAQRRIRPA